MTVVGYGSVHDREGRLFAAYRRDDEVVDLSRVDPELFAYGTLDFLLGAGPAAWERVADAVRDAEATHALADVRPQLPFTVADYVDFYASEHHASNVGRLFRPDADPLPASWKHLPIGYHGRSRSVVVSGTPVPRPQGVLGPGSFGPTRRLDFEAELGFVVGRGGSRIAVADADAHVFGVCLLNDWSARDIQRFETRPLGPFLGKSFATSVAAWVTPLTELPRLPSPPQDPEPVAPLCDHGRHGLDLGLEVRVNDTVVSRPPFGAMYWTYAQMLAHLTSNGARANPGDLYGSGTVSGPGDDELGCLLELTCDGTVAIDAGGPRTWLEDGDVVTIAAHAPGIALAEVTGRIGEP
ncbi:fumarylacetoacetate hydrolase [Jatrophihabitans endophyticus]|uniref:Fumarylacetoacetate hydrolase n=1 Tax=Jatrophihabitans endophyticus TaxID=1206085 RepID=A0A1M5BW44_9ACTN|nr:fumarylacetoacetate hydrolase family protein [Jatrophihabitans endophyticus]SHF46758.1 fumarylacetoacetate hydrolase [Jatrophihabitans endophyticus]